MRDARAVVGAYFAAFNSGDTDRMLALVSDDVEHHVNQGSLRCGRDAFAAFCADMGVRYREELRDIVIFTDGGDTRAAAEYTVHGTYLQTDPGLPEAKGQRYVLPAGSFLSLRDGKITRVATHYNLADWIAQVSA